MALRKKKNTITTTKKGKQGDADKDNDKNEITEQTKKNKSSWGHIKWISQNSVNTTRRRGQRFQCWDKYYFKQKWGGKWNR